MYTHHGSFVWNAAKEAENIIKHGVDFTTASGAFRDLKRKILEDKRHSHAEDRYFCLGRVGERIITVRFTFRGDKIRIIGAGFWRKGERYYEEKKIG
jgi:uncharacterized DUF497 family protein